ncbi:MAG: hypothetical protein PHV32_06190 [Eubacteriales bacterium]|nr:hypothetical protein [Eubacteriales bacterium]
MIIAEGKSHIISYEEYKEAVIDFTKSVEEFYNQSNQKVPFDDFEKAGYEAFWTEWNTLINRI